jgi:hypothetical protein
MMRNKGRANTRGGSLGLTRKKKPAPQCDPSCSHPQFVEVTTTQIKMADLDIRQVRLSEKHLNLDRCENCGRIREVYRDEYNHRQIRVIGEYDSCASPNRFTISPAILDEYLCMVKNGRIPG